jgi:intermembrane space import and assembly protein 40
MQDCFRQHPEMYGSELEDDEEEVEEELRAREAAPSPDSSKAPSTESAEAPAPSQKVTPEAAETKSIEQPHLDSSSTTAEKVQRAGDEGEELLPKAVHDATSK